MSNTVVFDTYSFVKKLKEAGLNERQAEIQAEALLNLVEDRLANKQDIQNLQRDLATNRSDLQRDLEAMRAESLRHFNELNADLQRAIKGIDEKIENTRAKLEWDIKELDTKIETIRAELKQDIKALEMSNQKEIAIVKAELFKAIAESKSETIRWVVGFAMAQFAMSAGIMAAVLRLAH
ncbi:MAG: DUF1640 domain-containing protein [Magnetococcales bacterium]|nr:DUF1640 domain-containing protein [Magnetococcales bacterium]NGZ28500.1 DUF1640 domain-containing protein [Magnetococcales bacterium]